jgi:hypothetical protein
MSEKTSSVAHQKLWHVTKKNLLNVCAIFVNVGYVFKDYTEIDTIYKTADGGKGYLKDKDFLSDCAN